MRKINVPLAFTACAVLVVTAAVFITAPANYGTNSAINQETNYWKWIFSSAFWTAVFTGMLTWSTIQLWRQTKRLAKGAEDQIAVAQKAADAAVAAQRPWLFIEVEAISPMTFDDDGPHVTLGFNIHNVGQTPATNVQFWGYLIASPEFGKLPIEPALHVARVWSEKVVDLDFGLSVYPGIISKQEQEQVLEEPFRVPNWKDWPKAVLAIPIIMTYRFVGGSGYTQCVFRISEATVLPRYVGTIHPARGPFETGDIACERLFLWDKAT